MTAQSQEDNWGKMLQQYRAEIRKLTSEIDELDSDIFSGFDEETIYKKERLRSYLAQVRTSYMELKKSVETGN